MKTYYILYNPLSASGFGERLAHNLDTILTEVNIRYQSLIDIPDMYFFLESLEPDATPVLTGGDGTICRFINALGGEVPKRDILYFPAGSGNDFLNDLGRSEETEPFLLNPYLENLPRIHFNGRSMVFLNGVGYGIDGFVCEKVAARRRQGKRADYTLEALKGLLYAYKRTSATVTVDGETYTFKHVWMTPTMNGRFFGGGMMCAPAQDRLNAEHTVSLMVMRSGSKLRTLLLFPSIFNGGHVKAKRVVTMYPGHHIHVSFDHPTALQIDGEVYSDVREYTVTTAVADGRLGAKEDSRSQKNRNLHPVH